MLGQGLKIQSRGYNNGYKDLILQSSRDVTISRKKVGEIFLDCARTTISGDYVAYGTKMQWLIQKTMGKGHYIVSKPQR